MRYLRRRRALRSPFPDTWRALLSRRLPWWRRLDAGERRRMEGLIREFTAVKLWEGGGGFEPGDDVRVTIAAEACLLVLGLDLDHYRDVTSIIVYPSATLRTGERSLRPGIVTETPLTLRGEAMLHGPVLITWDDVVQSVRHPDRGHNVVHHEFAHKLDMRDGFADGIPAIGSRALRSRFDAVTAAEFRRLEDGETAHLLDPYGATNRAEFFAVATEAFFDRPASLRDETPDLFEVLRDFYRQDPAERAGLTRPPGSPRSP
jgi:Mlc titration factor MtfA (ptsG expression regulator)